VYLLDTHVVSELRKSKPHGAVLDWLHGVPDTDLHMSAVTIGEIQSSIALTRKTNPAKATEIEHWFEQVASTYNILPMDATTFRQWARLMNGRSDELIEDAMIAATALCHDLIVVTRDVRDFEQLGTRTLDPFAANK
jgi:toxin FitB